jgi:hypothetical protein
MNTTYSYLSRYYNIYTKTFSSWYSPEPYQIKALEMYKTGKMVTINHPLFGISDLKFEKISTDIYRYTIDPNIIVEIKEL